MFAPILETLVFLVVFAVLEELRWEILDTPIKRRVVCACLAVLFGLVHFREAFQTAVVTMAGYVFIRILIEQRREGMMRQGYWWSVLAHSCYNATVISIMLLSPS
ncbi:MAG: CPBP family intramembrane metalloprotease [Rhodocyclaceae bacterium]|nr:CPBP family intramembrane metalloprotease [Rhodocyclaceae bacterium]